MKKIVLFFIFITQTIWAQTQFEAQVSQNTIELSQKLTINFVMNFDGDNFEAPNFEASGFKVAFGPGQSISQAWVNGHGSYKKSYSYVLMPIKKGTFTIKQATIEYNGKIFKSAPIKITVIDEQPDASQNNNAIVANNKVASNNLLLVADVSNPNPYINEPVTVTYKLYFGFNISITNDWNEVNKPKYNNFWSQNIDIKNIVPEESTLNGQRIRYAVLRQTILYPQKSGKLEIEPLALDIDYEVATGKVDYFGQPQMAQANKRVSTGIKIINAKPLPETGKPVNFTGAVGSFAFDAIPSRTTVKSGEAIDLNLAVNGSGNLKLFSLPKPVLATEFEVYDPEHKENITTNPTGLQGTVTDKYTIIPQSKGSFVVKPIAFSYFDLQTKSYKTIASNEIKITVLDGPIIATNNPVVNSKVTKNKSNNASVALSTKAILAIVALPLLALVAFLILKRKKKQVIIEDETTASKIKKADELAKKYLVEAKENINNKTLFYVSLEKSLHNFLKAKLHIETSEMSKENIKKLLQNKNISQETTNNFMASIENCEIARYAPSTENTITDDYDKTAQVMASLEKEMG